MSESRKDIRTPVNGNPYIIDSNNKIQVCWYDRMLNDQLNIYKDYGLEIENANAAKGWKEFKKDYSAKYDVPCLGFR